MPVMPAVQQAQPHRGLSNPLVLNSRAVCLRQELLGPMLPPLEALEERRVWRRPLLLGPRPQLHDCHHLASTRVALRQELIAMAECHRHLQDQEVPGQRHLGRGEKGKVESCARAPPCEYRRNSKHCISRLETNVSLPVSSIRFIHVF